VFKLEVCGIRQPPNQAVVNKDVFAKGTPMEIQCDRPQAFVGGIAARLHAFCLYAQTSSLTRQREIDLGSTSFAVIPANAASPGNDSTEPHGFDLDSIS